MKKALVFMVVLLTFPIAALAGKYTVPLLINNSDATAYWSSVNGGSGPQKIDHKKSASCEGGAIACTGDNPAIISVGEISDPCGAASAVPDTSNLPGQYSIYVYISGNKNSCSTTTVVMRKWTPINPIGPINQLHH